MNEYLSGVGSFDQSSAPDRKAALVRAKAVLQYPLDPAERARRLSALCNDSGFDQLVDAVFDALGSEFVGDALTVAIRHANVILTTPTKPQE